MVAEDGDIHAEDLGAALRRDVVPLVDLEEGRRRLLGKLLLRSVAAVEEFVEGGNSGPELLPQLPVSNSNPGSIISIICRFVFF